MTEKTHEAILLSLYEIKTKTIIYYYAFAIYNKFLAISTSWFFSNESSSFMSPFV